MSPAGCPRYLFPRAGVIALSCPLRGQPTVILSRRASGASKNLLRPPKSSYNALMPAYLYTKLYYIPARSFDYVPRYSLGTPLRMTGYAAFYAACLKRSLHINKLIPAAQRAQASPSTLLLFEANRPRIAPDIMLGVMCNGVFAFAEHINIP